MKIESSKPSGLVFIICLLLALPAFGTGQWLTLPSAWGQQPDPADVAKARERQERRQAYEMAKAERDTKRRNIETILQEGGPDAYRKYSDGTVVYLGLLLYRHEGFIINSGPAYAYLDKMAVLDAGFRVEDASDNGCRISPLRGSAYRNADNDIFAVGVKGYSGHTYSDILMLRHIGDFKYKTVAGASRIVPKFELGERATKEEYNDFFWKRKLAKVGGREPDDISPIAETGGGKSGGSGFFVTDDGYFVTCEHVVRGASSFHVKSPSGLLTARLIKKDRTVDVALLKVDGAFQALPVPPQPQVTLGEAVFTIGFPNPEVQGEAPKLTRGEISSLAGMRDNPHYFQISVPVQPGNSGGALVDESGNAVGVVRSRLDDLATYEVSGALPQNINYAVKGGLLYNFLSGVPALSGKLKASRTARDREAASGAAERAAVLVLAE